jgi:hypothetical protein
MLLLSSLSSSKFPKLKVDCGPKDSGVMGVAPHLVGNKTAAVDVEISAKRLEHLYKEKFKKVLPESFMQELKFRPDITRVDEPISGRFLLYAPKKQQVLFGAT